MVEQIFSAPTEPIHPLSHTRDLFSELPVLYVAETDHESPNAECLSAEKLEKLIDIARQVDNVYCPVALLLPPIP